ncbi:hypothetical protein D0T50_00975 [Bacteroides sp. 214]|uniref:LEM-3-like GIY-YIG domain-containing protein n=1 Tax=Bacteroides sp. 214 TaxID=2302935 RepID=UPI0013D4038E|nr:hypothetical protein [Bacteroides sp. 214]NDW11461.1 hypothetical protein [Bacteroides sp. 214]
MRIEKFSQAICERIGCYVYILIDPRDKTVFYVGKGVANRVFDHVGCALDSETENDKYNLIREITSEGYCVEHLILRHGIDEKTALEIESCVIDLFDYLYIITGKPSLTNIVKGHNSWTRGLKTVDEIIQLYDAKPVTLEEPCIIININRKYDAHMDDEKLYEATRASWVLGPKRNKAKYVVAAYRGLVREIYEIESWNPIYDRWEFFGKIADEPIRSKYKNGSLEKYIKKGGQNPIRYSF